MLKIDIISLFPEAFFGPFDSSIVKRARESEIVEINVVNLRDFTEDKHRRVDATPYGGGPGMVLKPEPIFKAVESLKTADSTVILMTPTGTPFKQSVAQELTSEKHLIFICGHYEGVDERVRTALVDREISIGDFILSSGNLAAMVISDAVIRLLPGALGSDASSVDESFSDGLLEYPQYTRPVDFNGMAVPEVLLSGNHKNIEKWRKQKAVELTQQRRPDLIKGNCV